MEDLIKSSIAQLGAIALLIGFMFWTIREKNVREKEDRDRMDKFVERVFTLTQNLHDAAIRLSVAVEKLRELQSDKE
jgi:hypothetical protein